MRRLAALVSCLALSAGVARAQVPADARQLVVVTTPSWTATDGTMQRYERARAGGVWRRVGAPVPIVVGRSGLGWGRGLHGAGVPGGIGVAGGGPIKMEGDGRAPAGVFRLTEAFAYAPTATGLPLKIADADLECVDDPASARYNEVIARPDAPDYASHEEMRRGDDLYRKGVVVAHNDTTGPAGRLAGRGSCIFLHQWAGADDTTSGCTAMAARPLDALVGWLDAARMPVMVQLPAAAHRALRRAWRLP